MIAHRKRNAVGNHMIQEREGGVVIFMTLQTYHTAE